MDDKTKSLLKINTSSTSAVCLHGPGTRQLIVKVLLMMAIGDADCDKMRKATAHAFMIHPRALKHASYQMAGEMGIHIALSLHDHR